MSQKYEKERRLIELRADADSEQMILEGYPIVFEQETIIGEGSERAFIEVIDRHALDEADMSDVCLRYNHLDTFAILARTRNDSLELKKDEHGCFMRGYLIDTTSNKDIYKMAKAGLLSQGSFAFTVAEQEVTKRDGMLVRRITKISKLFDVSIVDTPAYDSTEIYARSCDLVETMSPEVETEEEQAERNKYKLSSEARKIIMMTGGKYHGINT